MVQGLAFLSKKSWHTKNLANQEKVWMAEQQKAAEESKTKELAKQIQQEREQEELDKLAGRKPSKKDRGIDWMYQGGTGEAAREDELRKNEEYLMGKEYVPDGKLAAGDFTELDAGGVNAAVASAASVPDVAEKDSVPEGVAAAAPVNQEPSVHDRNESFTMRHEDPMFLVSQQQKEKQAQHEKKRALFERVVGPTEDKKPDERRRAKKERKRDRKHRHRDHESRRHRKRRHRSRSRSRERHSSRHEDREHRRRRHERRHRSRSPSRERSRSRSPAADRGHYDRRHVDSGSDRDEYGRSGRQRYTRREESRRYRSRSRSRSPRERRTRRDSPTDNYDRRGRSGRGPSPPRHGHDDDRSVRPAGFGLQGAAKSYSHHGNDDLGPNQQLLDKRRQERDDARRRMRDVASTRRRMTAEERAAALEAMQSDASRRDEALNRASQRRALQDDDDDLPSRGKASFLQDMAQETHGIRSSDGNNLASRVARNRHSNQRANDDFM